MAQQFQSKIISASAVSVNSAAIDASNMYSMSVQVITTGTAVGTVKLQASNDTPIGSPGFGGGVFTPTNWTDIASATVTISAAGSLLIPKTDLCYQFVRAVLTVSGGTGTVTVQIKVLSV